MCILHFFLLSFLSIKSWLLVMIVFSSLFSAAVGGAGSSWNVSDRAAIGVSPFLKACWSMKKITWAFFKVPDRVVISQPMQECVLYLYQIPLLCTRNCRFIAIVQCPNSPHLQRPTVYTCDILLFPALHLLSLPCRFLHITSIVVIEKTAGRWSLSMHVAFGERELVW